jgi:GntR family transcriptional regulator
VAKAAGGDGDAAGAAKYQAIVDDFQTAIASGSYKFDDQLPTEGVIMDEYDVSRPTAHRAMVELEALGLVETRRGVGTFVRAWTPIIRNIGKRMSADVWGAGKSVWSFEVAGREYGVDSERVQRGEVPDYVAELLGESTAVIRRRRHMVDGRLVMLSTSYYPTSIAGGSPIELPNTGPGGAPARLGELGHAPVENSERMRVRLATPSERRELRLPKGGVVVEFKRKSLDAGGTSVEVTEMIAAADAYVFQFDYTS